MVKMRKIIFCLLLHIPALLRGADYYIAPYPTGNNSTGNGSAEYPWATLSYALSQGYVNTYGNTIHLADGSYSESGRLTINPGVSIQGASMEGTIIHLTYHNGTAEDACFYLYSSTLTAGNQSISYLALDGGNTGGKAILVRRRHNVDIAHVTVKDFLWGGIHYRNQDGWRTPPAVYASGSEVIECILTNCSDRTYTSYDPGNLRIDGQMNFDVFEVEMRNNQRPAGHNGNLFNMSFCHNVRAWYCEFIKPDGDGGQWNFYGENFHLRGGIDIGWCSFTGVANLNFSNAAPDGYSTRGSYDYTVDVHDCTFTTASGSQINSSLMAHNQAAITFEKGFWDHCHVRRNHIYRFPYGVTVCAPVDHTIEFSHIYIESNLLENIGYSDHPYTWGIAWLLENNGGYGVTMDHMYVQNNTITGGSGYNYNGIRWVANGTATNIYIRNNIIYGWDQGACYIPKQSGESASFNGLTITNECYYGNGGNYLQIASDITKVGSDLDPPLTSNPNFVSSTDFHLTEGSPCIEAGTSSAGVELDLDGISYYTPPSIGCYEYMTTPPTYTHTYFVKNGGNDGLDGRSDANAWATIAKVNAVTLYPGDTVLFKRGDTWQEQVSLVPQSGSSSGYVIYSAYGEGNKPRILGSKQENSSGDWVNTGTNLWRNADAYFVNSQGGVGNLIFNNEAIIGHKVYSSGDLDTQGKFYYDLSNQHLTLYSTTNPASYYSDIKCALGKDAVRLWSGQDYVIIESLEFAYWGAHGISAGGGNSNIIIRDCSFKYIGGGDFDGGSYGNAVQFWASYSNILVERNNFYEIYDAAITPQFSGTNSVTATNFVARLNIIEKAYWSFEWFCSTSSASTVNGIYFQHNTCYDAGNSWSNAQRPLDQNEGRHLQLWSYDTDVSLSNFYIRNNIFSKATETAIRVGQTLAPLITFDYNLYDVDVMAYDWNTYTSLSQWQAAYSKDAHSISDDPEFLSSSDFHLASTSPAIGAGYNVGYTYDFDLENFLAPPSIGAYEYLAGGEPPEEPEPGTIIWRYARKAGKFLMKFGKMVKKPVLIPEE